MSTKRLTKGSKLTFKELDTNFEEIEGIFLQKANVDLSNVTELSQNVRNALKGEKGDVGDVNPANIANADSAARSANRAEISKVNADNAATRSETSATNAANSRSQAATSATNSANSATQAATSASNASLSANTATTKASEASSSASSAATSATNSANSAASALAIYGSINAINVAVNNSSASATASANSASNASVSATNAANSATASANSALQASNSANNTSALLASFRSVFLGSFATDSEAVSFANTNSIALTDGVMYENTTGTPNKFRIYNGVSWDDYDSSAQASQSAAALSAANSASSASASATSATNAANSATASANSATASATSATNSANSATASANSAGTSGTKAAEASTSANNAATSATNSAASATTASNQADIATTKAANANSSATTAATQATNAATSANSAATSATNAANSATSSATSAADSANSATAASGSATGASTSASISSASASNAAASATSASGSAATATTQAGNAGSSATNASNSASSALTSKNAAATSESNAANSSATATTQANIATSKASEAATSATNAANAATSAVSAKVAAESARDQALTAFDNFDDRYLGQKSSNPTLDNDGNALLVGALYFNTVAPGSMKVYDGTSWLNAYSSLSGALLSANNLSDVANTATARANLGAYAATNPNGYISGITSVDVANALGFTPYSASNPNSYTTLAAVAAVGYATGGGTASGTNTGDETAATIKNKLNITTLSGSNTGDQVLPTLSSLGAYAASNPSGYISGITSANVTSALGFTPYNATNPSGYITGITSSNVTNALGYTPYNSSNPNGYITSSGSISGNAATASNPASGGSFITSSNIGSQSVSYASSAGSASSATTATTASAVPYSGISSRPSWLNDGSMVGSHSNANEWRNSGFYENGGGGSNWPSATWYNSINVRHSNQENYHGFQLAMSFYDNNLWFRSYQGAGTFQSWALALSSANYSGYSNFSGNSVYGGIYYDGNDTGYYCNPNDLSRFNSIQPNTIRLPANTGYYLFGSSGDPSCRTGVINADQLISYGDSRGTTFYDQNDTGYYCDPNGTSRFAALNLNTGNWLYSSEGHARILFDSSGSTHLRGIWGDSWWLRFGWQNNDSSIIFEGSGNIYAQGNITAYWSDRRLKTNIKKIDNWRTIIDGINGYFYEWNENGKRVLVGDDPKDQGTMVGFIAQEVNAVLPQAAAVQELQFKNGKHEPRDDIADIVDLDDPFLTVKEEKLMPVLTEAIKWLLAEVDQLKLQIKELEKKA